MDTMAIDQQTISNGTARIKSARIFTNEETGEKSIALQLEGISSPIYFGIEYLYADLELLLPTKSLHKGHLMLLQGATASWTEGRLLVPETEYEDRNGKPFFVKAPKADLKGIKLELDYFKALDLIGKIPTSVETLLFVPESMIVKAKIVGNQDQKETSTSDQKDSNSPFTGDEDVIPTGKKADSKADSKAAAEHAKA